MNPAMAGFERESLMAVVNSKRVWLTHVIANAVLMVAFFYWTRIPDERGWQFAITVVAGVLIAFFTLWLHGATFNYFAKRDGFTLAFKRSVARVPWFLLWTVIFGAVLWAIGHAWDYDAQTGGWLRHLLPGFARKGSSPKTVISLTSAVIWFLFYFLWPVIALPMGAQTAVRGIRGMFSRTAFRPLRSLHFWMLYAAIFLVCAYVPYKLAWMTPTQASSLNAQTWSMVIRLGVAYLLVVTGWLVLCAAIARATGEAIRAPAAEAEPISAMPQV
jgi:hypothetical protein